MAAKKKMQSEKSRVYLVDDHPIVRQGLRQILSEIPDMLVAGEAVNGQETLDQVRAGGWDVLVLDITMPDRDPNFDTDSAQGLVDAVNEALEAKSKEG